MRDPRFLRPPTKADRVDQRVLNPSDGGRNRRGAGKRRGRREGALVVRFFRPALFPERTGSQLFFLGASRRLGGSESGPASQLRKRFEVDEFGILLQVLDDACELVTALF